MRFIDIEEAVPGMMLSGDMIDDFGRMLIAKNAVLTSSYIQKLKERGSQGVYIDDEYSEGIEVKPLISTKLKAEAMEAVASFDVDACKSIAQNIVKEILENGIASSQMKDIRDFDNYTFAHSVNVAVLSCTLAFGLGLEDSELEDIVLACLFHDIGKSQIPDEVLNKPGRLTPEEFALIKTHSTLSYNMISERMDISSLIKNAVLCHHENYDGSGYPMGKAQNNIHLYARIIHVCDVYDALVSKRPYKNPYSPYAAIEIIKGGSGTLYDPTIVNEFLKHVPLYPKGTSLIVSGRECIVVENSGKNNERPIIRFKDDLSEIDLSTPDLLGLEIKTPNSENLISIFENENKRGEMQETPTRYNILVLDANGDTYKLLHERLDYLYEFKHVASEALAKGYLLKGYKPDLILVDVDYINLDYLDMESSYEMNKLVTSAYPVLCIGSFADVDTIIKFRRLGIMNYVLKPFSTVYVQAEIKRIIEVQIDD